MKEAKQGRADLVVLPELLTFDAWPFGKPHDDVEVVKQIARAVTPAYFKAITALARAYQVTIVGGSSPRLHQNLIYNTAIVAFPDGRSVQQDKVNLTEWEAEAGMSPDDTLRPFDTPWGKAVVVICYDIEFPTVSAALVDAQPAFSLVPSMTDSVHGLERVRWSAQARAVEHHAFVIVAGTVGHPSKDWPNVGQAAFITPRREAFPVAIDQSPRDAAGVFFSTLDVDTLTASRKAAKLYPAKDVMAAQKKKRRLHVTVNRAHR